MLFDHVGAGLSDLSAYDPRKYGTLAGYASDLLEICQDLDLRDVVFVGHSVSAMNPLGWSAAMAPVIMEQQPNADLAQELNNSFCRTDPAIAKYFARVTFLSDNRAGCSTRPISSCCCGCKAGSRRLLATCNARAASPCRCC